MPVDYSLGKVYKIVGNGKVYVGSTTNPLSQRSAEHKNDYKRWTNGKRCYTTSFECITDPEYYIELLELCPCSCIDELRKCEGKWIRELECVNKKMEGQTQKEYRDEHKEEILEKQKVYYEANKEHILEKGKEHYESNKERVITRTKAYQAANKVHLAQKAKEYYEANKEAIRKRQNAYQLKKKAEQ